MDTPNLGCQKRHEKSRQPAETQARLLRLSLPTDLQNKIADVEPKCQALSWRTLGDKECPRERFGAWISRTYSQGHLPDDSAENS
ncbi:MAG: hypothetical protein EDM74_06710 [Armatimonadetes bacterium]|nr:MAG: hypothetical protein EDM74_06710 [Armatimonadota bacterium]